MLKEFTVTWTTAFDEKTMKRLSQELSKFINIIF